CNSQFEMQHRTRVGLNNHVLLHLQEALRRDCHRVSSDGDRTEFKLSAVAAVLGLSPVRGLGLQRNLYALNGAVLLVMDHASHTAKDGRRQRRTKDQERRRQKGRDHNVRRNPGACHNSSPFNFPALQDLKQSIRRRATAPRRNEGIAKALATLLHPEIEPRRLLKYEPTW